MPAARHSHGTVTRPLRPWAADKAFSRGDVRKGSAELYITHSGQPELFDPQ
jgi:hypothetical protein